MTRFPLGLTEWTVDDLGQLPDDGLQYELLDGVLHVSSWPAIKHQVVRTELARLLGVARPPDLLALATPVEWRPDETTSLQPDVVVFPTKFLDRDYLSDPPTLAVEVLSPSTRHRDLVLKCSKYQTAGVMSYWVVDPEAPSILAWELMGGRYEVVGQVEGDERLELKRPFPVAVTPSELLVGYR